MLCRFDICETKCIFDFKHSFYYKHSDETIFIIPKLATYIYKEGCYYHKNSNETIGKIEQYALRTI